MKPLRTSPDAPDFDKATGLNYDQVLDHDEALDYDYDEDGQREFANDFTDLDNEGIAKNGMPIIQK